MSKKNALTAIALLAPVPSFGVASALFLMPGPVGQAVFTFCKLWILALPAFWFFVIEKQRIRFSGPSLKHLPIALGTGLIGAAAVVLAYFAIAAPRINAEALRETTVELGIGSPLTYIAGALYWIFINSLIEEYVYRWFLMRQAGKIMTPLLAVLLSSLVFTLHHIIALHAYLNWGLTSLASLGIFIGGATWATIYLRVRSIWPCWLSHMLIDIAVFALGYIIIFS